MSLPSKAQHQYLTETRRCQDHVLAQADTLEKISQAVFQSLQAGGVLHVFGTGHSHSLAEELFHRAGGLIPVNAMLEEYMMPHMGAGRVGPIERLPGLAPIIYKVYGLQKGEVLFLASNSGINAVTVEMAKIAKENGVTTVGFTSLTHSKNVPSRAGVDKLYQVVDFVVDTGTPVGDACVAIDGLDVKACPLSTGVTVFAAQLIVARVCEIFAEKKLTPPVYQSANTPGGDERNKKLEAQYKSRLIRLS